MFFSGLPAGANLDFMQIAKERAPRSAEPASLVEAGRVHGSLYTDPAVFAEELERIFYRGWVFVGHESEIPAPGDYVCRAIGLEPVILVRANDGSVRVHSNRCTHRGNMLCRSESGRAKLLKCDYHGWTFSLDGELLAVPNPGGFHKERSQLPLRAAAQVESCCGFVFACLNGTGRTLDAHLGAARNLIERSARMSPVGRVRLSAGWVRQRINANWKMLPENATDGYHVGAVHASFLQVFRRGPEDPEGSRGLIVKDWGGGHAELDFSPRYDRALQWLGISEERAPGYVRSMIDAWGEEAGRRLLRSGPPHAVIFPNLLLGEMNVAIFQPLSANESVQWHTPMLLEGVDEILNARIIRQSEGAMGPSGFLLADDAVISERQQLAMRGQADWLELGRGVKRERREAGAICSFATDEVNNRGFWRHYRSVMEPPAGAAPGTLRR